LIGQLDVGVKGGKGYKTVDQNKAYTARIRDMTHLPVYDEFCFFRPYDKSHKLQEYHM
jgi:hypothetical protein